MGLFHCKPKIDTPSHDFLYVILPYFNFQQFHRRRELFLEFIAKYRHEKHIRIVVSEASLLDQTYHLPKHIDGVFLHLRYDVEHPLWIKENLIELAISRLPSDWKYMAWIDADITFLQPHWARDTIEKLKSMDVLQLFRTCIHLGPSGEIIKTDLSFFYQYHESGKPYHPQYKYGHWHPGFAWAMNRKAYAAMNHLVDFAILGSADRHMALALIGFVQHSYPGGIQNDYKEKLKEFQERCRGLRASYLPGTIAHHWHGRLADRKYRERWNILVDQKYCPEKDICKNKLGVVEFTDSGKRLIPYMTDYFAGRKEDNMDVL